MAHRFHRTVKELRAITAHQRSERGPYPHKGQTLGVGLFTFPVGTLFRKDRRERDARAGRRPGPPGSRPTKRAANGLRYRLTHVNWFLRIVREMKGCPEVEKAVLSGKLDKLLPAAQ